MILPSGPIGPGCAERVSYGPAGHSARVVDRPTPGDPMPSLVFAPARAHVRPAGSPLTESWVRA